MTNAFELEDNGPCMPAEDAAEVVLRLLIIGDQLQLTAPFAFPGQAAHPCINGCATEMRRLCEVATTERASGRRPEWLQAGATGHSGNTL